MYGNLKAILFERQRLTTPKRFLRRLQKTAGFGTKAVVGKAVIRKAFICQMPPSVHAHLSTQPNSVSLENLAMLADRAVAAEKDVDEAKPGVAKINERKARWTVGRPVSQAQETRDSHSQGHKEEDIRTLTTNREPCSQDTVRSECSSKTFYT